MSSIIVCDKNRTQFGRYATAKSVAILALSTGMLTVSVKDIYVILHTKHDAVNYYFVLLALLILICILQIVIILLAVVLISLRCPQEGEAGDASFHIMAYGSVDIRLNKDSDTWPPRMMRQTNDTVVVFAIIVSVLMVTENVLSFLASVQLPPVERFTSP